MNNNTRGIRSNSQKQSAKNSGIGTRHSSISTSNNNIHININLNVKKKSHCIHAGGQTITGKKINNFIQVSEKPDASNITEQQMITSHQIMKSNPINKNKFLFNNKNDHIKQNQKIKKKKIKDKQKTNSKPFTPQKQFKGQSQEKSLEKSKTGKKLIKKKQSRSMENLKVFKQKPLYLQENKKINNFTKDQKDLKDNKFKSRSNSSSKQRSRQKSSKKMKKNRSSSKNVATFQNSGIKKVLISEKQTVKKNQTLDNMRKSKKSLKVNNIAEKDMIKINQFMQQKKKNEEKKKKQSQHNSKGIKIKDQILKASKKDFYSKPQKKQISHSVSQVKKKSKFPIFYGEDQNNQSDDYNNFFENKNIRYDHVTPQKSRPYSKHISPQGLKKSSGKKKTQQCLVEKYLKQQISKEEKKQLKKKIIFIQACWRGYKVRKIVMQQISKMNKLTFQKKKLISEKKSEFWDDDDNNSIINLENKDQHIDKYRENVNHQIQQKNLYKTPQNSNYNSSQTPTQENHTNHKKYQSQSGQQNQFMSHQHHDKSLNINEFKKNIAALQKQKQFLKNQSEITKKLQNQNNDNILASQIQMLKKQIQDQNMKFIKLERQNCQLKQNLKSIVVDKQKGLKNQTKQPRPIYQIHNNNTTQPIIPIDLDEDSAMIYQLNKPNLNLPGEEKQDIKKLSNQRFKNLKISTETLQDLKPQQNKNLIKPQSPSNPYVQNLKRQLQSFQSPSNRTLKNAQLSGLKNLQKAFKKKQLLIEIKYEKNSSMYQQMLQNNIVSPKTYNFKKVQLEESYKKQKEQISLKYQEAEKVIKYISEQIVEEGAGEDESPQKNINGQVQKMQGLTKKDFQHVSEKIDVQVSGKNNLQEWSKSNEMKQDLNKQIESYEFEDLQVSNGSQSGQSNFRKYWTEDMQEVHKRVLQISNKIDEALQADSKYSESLRSDSDKEYSSQNSNFHSLKSNGSDDAVKINQLMNQKEQKPKDDIKSPIFQQTEYKIIEQQNDQKQQKLQQSDDVMPNNSNVSSTSSGRNLQAYNIHYPSSPNSQKSQKGQHNFEVKNQVYDQGQDSIQGNNNSQLSQNRSQLSENLLRSSSVKLRQSKGFDTRLTFIKQYCIALCEFIRSEDDLKQRFVDNISTPLKYDYFQYLKSYRTNIKNQNDTKYNSTLQDYIYPYFKVIKGALGQKGLNLQNTVQFQQLYEQNYNVNKQLTKQMQQIRKYFIQAIIDVFNQSLDFQRPGSIYGQPLPWLVQSKNLKNNQVKFLNQPQFSSKNHDKQYQDDDENIQAEQDERLDKIFGVAIAKIIQWGSCLCGFIPQPVSFDGQDAQTVNIDQEQTNLVRQTRLAYMLQKSLAQDEQKMIDNTMQQLQVQLQLQQMILYELVSQAVKQIAQLTTK